MPASAKCMLAFDVCTSLHTRIMCNKSVSVRVCVGIYLLAPRQRLDVQRDIMLFAGNSEVAMRANGGVLRDAQPDDDERRAADSVACMWLMSVPAYEDNIICQCAWAKCVTPPM